MFHGKRSILGMLAAAGMLMAGFAQAATPAAKAKAPAKAASGGDEVAILETSKGRMVVEFWEKDAPKTVANFKKLSRTGFYNGTGFHRIIKNFMVQGGDPKSKNPNAPDLGTGGSDAPVPDEFNAHKHVKGVLSMASSGPGTARSQFFIMHATAYPSLDGKYTAFGRVIQGMDVLDKIASVPTGPNAMMRGEDSKPLEWVTLKTVKVMPRAAWAAANGGGTVKASATTGAGLTVKSPKVTAPKTVEAKPADDKGTVSTPATPTTPAAGTTNPAGSAPADTAK